MLNVRRAVIAAVAAIGLATTSMPAYGTPLTWSQIPTATPPPPARSDGVMVYDFRNDRFVLFGGKIDATGRPTAETWELRRGRPTLPASSSPTWSWSPLRTSTSPTPRFSLVGGVAEVSGVSYFVIATGDLGTGSRTNDVWALDLSTSTNTTTSAWVNIQTTGDVLTDRYGAVGGIPRNSSLLYVSHGFDRSRYSNTLVLDLSSIASRRAAWRTVHEGTNAYNPSLPHGRCLGAGTVTDQSELVLFGGCLTGGKSGGPCPSNDGWTLDLQKREWMKAERQPAASTVARMVPLHSLKTVLLYGGNHRSAQVLAVTPTPDNEVNILRPRSGTWTTYMTTGRVPATRKAPFLASVTTLDGVDEVYLWGGGGDTIFYSLSGSPAETTVEKGGKYWFTLWMLHGIFMVLGWGICLQLGAFVARYFRHKDPFWFKFHRLVQSIGLLLAFVGFVLGIVTASTVAATPFQYPHAIIGLVVMVIGIAQPINAFYRPHVGEKNRALWSFFHINLGRGALILGQVNNTLGLFLALAATYLWALWFVYLGLTVLAYIIFEIKLRREKKHTEPAASKGQQQMDSIMLDSTSNKKVEMEEQLIAA